MPRVPVVVTESKKWFRAIFLDGRKVKSSRAYVSRRDFENSVKGESGIIVPADLFTLLGGRL